MPTIEEALAAFERQAKANGRSPHSIRQTRRHVCLLATWIASEGRSLDVADLDPATVAEFMGSAAASPTEGMHLPLPRLRKSLASRRAQSVHVALETKPSADAAYRARIARGAARPPRGRPEARSEQLGVRGRLGRGVQHFDVVETSEEREADSYCRLIFDALPIDPTLWQLP